MREHIFPDMLEENYNEKYLNSHFRLYQLLDKHHKDFEEGNWFPSIVYKNKELELMRVEILVQEA